MRSWTTGQKISFIVALVIAGIALFMLFKPVTWQTTAPERTPGKVHYDAVRVQCGSWAVREHRHDAIGCPYVIRDQRIFGYAIAIAAVPTMLAGVRLFRPGRDPKRAAIVFLGWLFVVGAAITTFDPLWVDHFDDRVIAIVQNVPSTDPPRRIEVAPRGPFELTFTTTVSRCGSIIFKDSYREPDCDAVLEPMIGLAAAIAGVGLLIMTSGVVLFPGETARRHEQRVPPYDAAL